MMTTTAENICFRVIIAILIIVSCLTSSWDEECQSSFKFIHRHLATKTPYRYMGNYYDAPWMFSGDCRPERIWMIVRHGTRNPSRKVIKTMRLRLPQLRDIIVESAEEYDSRLCKGAVNAFRDWMIDLNEDDEKHLTPEGEDEMFELAKRYQSRFPDLFPFNYTNSTYKFRYTKTQRTAASAHAFTAGLFGKEMSHLVWFPGALSRDPILRFYKLCERWRREVDKNPESLRERNLFEAGPEMQETLEDVSIRLRLNRTLSVEDVSLMYVTCAFETAWYYWKNSPWCAVFSEENFKVLEYAEDLEYYWIDGYGHELTYKQACPAVGDMAQHILNSDPGEEPLPNATVYFTHSGTLLKILSHLGLYRDKEPLLHNNHKVSRKWRVSRIDSFATNLAFILFKCSDGPKVLTLHQEWIVTIPGCPSYGNLCPIDLLRRRLRDSIENCDFQNICDI